MKHMILVLLVQPPKWSLMQNRRRHCFDEVEKIRFDFKKNLSRAQISHQHFNTTDVN